MKPPVFVAQPSMPPLEELQPYLERIWESRVLTNNGPYNQQLEQALANFLDVPHLTLFNNGTMALFAALKCLELSGEVITTPYTFIATPQAIAMAGLTPVFTDVDPNTGNLEPASIEKAITENTCAIMPVHCYGASCDIDAIQRLAEKHGLKVIYDAAHAFGASDSGGSLARHGDLAALSFHATKAFNTIEGGAVVSHSLATHEKLCRFRNFGMTSETEISESGMNGKLNEISAAFGLVQLDHFPAQISQRRRLAEEYVRALENVTGVSVLGEPASPRSNHTYMPVLIDPKVATRDDVYEHLRSNGIHARRYFYPLVTDTGAFSASASPETPCARMIAQQIICLPLHANLDIETVHSVCAVLKAAL